MDPEIRLIFIFGEGRKATENTTFVFVLDVHAQLCFFFVQLTNLKEKESFISALNKTISLSSPDQMPHT